MGGHYGFHVIHASLTDCHIVTAKYSSLPSY